MTLDSYAPPDPYVAPEKYAASDGADLSESDVTAGKFYEDAYSSSSPTAKPNSEPASGGDFVVDADADDGSDIADVSVSDSEENEGGYGHVFSEIGSGMVEEIVDHPGRVLSSAALGVGAAVATVLLAPEVALVVAVGAGAYALLSIFNAMPGWLQDADVAANPDEHTDAEVEAADAGLRSIGAGAVDIAAATVAAPIGGVIGGLVATPVKAAAAELVTSVAGYGRSALSSQTGERVAGAVTTAAANASNIVSPYVTPVVSYAAPYVESAAKFAAPYADHVINKVDDVQNRFVKAVDRIGDSIVLPSARKDSVAAPLVEGTGEASFSIAPRVAGAEEATLTIGGKVAKLYESVVDKGNGVMLTASEAASPYVSNAASIAMQYVRGAGNRIITFKDKAMGVLLPAGERLAGAGGKTAEVSPEFAAKVASRAELLDAKINEVMLHYGDIGTMTEANLSAMGLALLSVDYKNRAS